MGFLSPLHYLIILCVLLVPVGVVIVLVILLTRTANPKIMPNLTPCPDCGRMVSRLAKTCPQCGRPFQG